MIYLFVLNFQRGNVAVWAKQYLQSCGAEMQTEISSFKILQFNAIQKRLVGTTTSYFPGPLVTNPDKPCPRETCNEGGEATMLCCFRERKEEEN